MGLAEGEENIQLDIFVLVISGHLVQTGRQDPAETIEKRLFSCLMLAWEKSLEGGRRGGWKQGLQ